MLTEELLNIICCPGCHSDLVYDIENFTLTCGSCRKVYEIKNDIPILIVEESHPDE